MPLTQEDVAAIETVAHYTHDEDQAYLMLYGEGVFDTIPIEADYTVGDMKMWLKYHKSKDPSEYDLVGPKGVWKMGAGSEVANDLMPEALSPAFAVPSPPLRARAPLLPCYVLDLCYRMMQYLSPPLIFYTPLLPSYV